MKKVKIALIEDVENDVRDLELDYEIIDDELIIEVPTIDNNSNEELESLLCDEYGFNPDDVLWVEEQVLPLKVLIRMSKKHEEKVKKLGHSYEDYGNEIVVSVECSQSIYDADDLTEEICSRSRVKSKDVIHIEIVEPNYD